MNTKHCKTVKEVPPGVYRGHSVLGDPSSQSSGSVNERVKYGREYCSTCKIQTVLSSERVPHNIKPPNV
jgi:hypothetical protein